MNTRSMANATRHTLRTGAVALGVCLLCSACQSLPQKVMVDFAEPKINPAAAKPPATVQAPSGSLYQAAGYRPSFEDRRARQVGDTVTIQIVESLTASQVSNSTVNRTSSMNTSISALPLKDYLSDLTKLQAGAATANDFSGKGGTAAANTFSGSITATVMEVLPNGHLLVTGEKQIGVNQNVDVMRFSGTVDPRLVQPGGIVSSTQVANVRIESKGRGAQGEAQTVGWLSRFFLSLNPF